MIKNLFLASFKQICVVFSYFTKEKKKSGCSSPNMDVRAGKRKGEYTYSVCLDSIKCACKPGMKQDL